MVVYSRDELNNYLNNINFDRYKETALSSVYVLLRYKVKGKMMNIPVYFSKHEGSYFESPCKLSKIMDVNNDNDIEAYVKELYQQEYWNDAVKYEKAMVRDGVLYEIVNWQCELFLPCEKGIEIVSLLKETECLDLMLKE